MLHALLAVDPDSAIKANNDLKLKELAQLVEEMSLLRLQVLEKFLRGFSQVASL